MVLASVVLIVLGLAIVVAVVMVARRRESSDAVPVAVHARPDLVFDEDVDGLDAVGRVPERASLPEPVAPPSWPEQVHRGTGALDDEARLRLIGDLGMLRAAWCVPILERAATEETNPELHAAALAALAKCRRPATTIASNGRVHTPLPEEAE